MKLASLIKEQEYYVTYNKGRGQGKGLVRSKESDYEEPRVFSKEEAEEYVKRVKSSGATPGQITAYWVSDRDMNRINENIDTYDFLKQNRGQIELDHGPRTYRTLQTSLMMDDEVYVRNWLIKNGYMDEEKLPFEEGKVCESCGLIHEGSCGYTHTSRGEKLRTPGGTNDPAIDKIREYIRENLRNWFKKEKWKRIDTQGNIAGDCGTMPKGKKTQRCLPAAKARSLTKKQRAATSRKKTRSKKQFVKNTKAAKVKLKK